MRRAFSLIELLVVISIIAIIMAIALPAMARSRRTAQDGVSQTNIKGLGQWHSVWNVDHKNGFYNPFLGVTPVAMAQQIGYNFRWLGGVEYWRYDSEGFAPYWYPFMNQAVEQGKLPIESFFAPMDVAHRERLHQKFNDGTLLPGSYFYSAAFWKAGFGYCKNGNEFGQLFRNIFCEPGPPPPEPEKSINGGIALWSLDQVAYPNLKVLLYERADFMKNRRASGTGANGPVDITRPPAWNNPSAKPNVLVVDASVRKADMFELSTLALGNGLSDGNPWRPTDAVQASDAFPVLGRNGNGVIQPQGSSDAAFPLFFSATANGPRGRDLPR